MGGGNPPGGATPPIFTVIVSDTNNIYFYWLENLEIKNKINVSKVIRDFIILENNSLISIDIYDNFILLEREDNYK